MLLRQDVSGIVAIPQPSHAWLAGQMARAWGNEDFAAIDPMPDVCLAIEQHDIGWLDIDQEAEFDPRTGTAREFWHVPAVRHTALWSAGVRRARTFGRYPALLVSLHGVAIYDRTFDTTTATLENAKAVERFRAEQHEVQAELLASLQEDPAMRQAASPEAVDRNRHLLLALDTLSLHLCWGMMETVQIDDVPASGMTQRSLTLRPAPGRPDRNILEPWPFRGETLQLKAEGRRLTSKVENEGQLKEIWDRADTVAIDVMLSKT